MDGLVFVAFIKRMDECKMAFGSAISYDIAIV